MAEIITVDDPDDPRLSDYTGLTDVELRRRREPAEGLFIAEGEKVIRRARQAGYEMRSMLLSAKWVDVMRDVIDEIPAPVYAVHPDLAERVTGYHVHRGALASMQRKPLPAAAELLGTARRIVVMEAVNDHTNIGAIFRSAAALGMDAVLLSPDCADPLYRRSVKVSMGAVFSVPYARLTSWPRDLATVREAGFKLLALTPAERATAIDEAAVHTLERAALMLGAEGGGLTTGALRAADEWVRIPMAHGVDSLNVGAAAAVAFYAVATGRPEA
ncbi:TrmH family RNA methyltransferase [Streptomyces celluloflavus]|uniref:RNA methyltransferase n=1 Tax=Streptomyces kasugaensis TaxID=1946 RepID=A0A4V2JHJ2_STRKA|nr:RNA methyltransferase [Streptomyces kasugaensis]MYU55679.1 rRNA methyltransferase [Streptomyces sp. SID7805]TBO54791.1 RNA methyltransferase [Streptomyces kasugaensis]